uniref:Interferon kappa n=1 Tax=Pseudonaja textilis TaxID=8673 RepID=A0A670Z431_PSETE
MAATSTPVPMGLLCLVFLLAVPASGLHCNLLKRQQQRWNQQSMELLKGMKAKIPPECWQKMPEVSFPIKILGIRQPRAATKAILEMLRGFLHLFKEEHLWVAWDLLQYLRTEELHEQTQRLQRCLEGEKLSLGKSKKEWMHKLELKKYFRSIENFLKEKGLDSCTQEFIRHEIQADFTLLSCLRQDWNSPTPIF